MLREARIVVPGVAHHVTQRSNNRQDVFFVYEDGRVYLVKNPRHDDPEIADWLKYIVCGDVVFDDGTEATLDELCAEIGEEPLPYLEPMPPLLEVDWYKAD